MVKKSYNVFAAIHLGSEKISLKIIEYRSLNTIKELDAAEKIVRLGEETFKTGKISSGMIKEICEILNNYKQKIKEYNVDQYIIVGTTAMREAQNRKLMIDQIFMATGFKVEVIDMPLEIYYKYIFITRTLKEQKVADDGSATLFADISSGGLGITLVENSTIKYQQNIHIGVIRVKESFNKNERSSSNFNTALTEYISSIISPVHNYLKKHTIKQLVLTGTNTDLLLKMLSIKEKKNSIHIIPTEQFQMLFDNVTNMKLAKIMQQFKLSEQVAEVVLPTIIFYQQLIKLTSVPKLIFPPNTFIDALPLLHVARETNDPWIQELYVEIINFIYNIANNYLYNKEHCKKTAFLAELIFDRTAKIHHLNERYRLILNIASILHDIGKCINLRQHYIHSYHLIMSTDIFCLSQEEKQITALTAYYHTKNLLDNQQFNNTFTTMTKKQFSIVAKLSVILKISDALDRSYKQKIKDCKISLKNDEMHIIVTSKKDLTLERWTLESKVDAFIEVFGIKPVLIEKNN